MEPPPVLSLLRVHRLRISLRPLRSWRPPSLPAATLRGATGRALRHLACPYPEPRCADCPTRERCDLAWFDPALLGGRGPAPFALRARALRREAGRPWTAEWVFLSPPPAPGTFLRALQRALRKGLGAGRIPHEAEHLLLEGDGGTVEIRELEAAWPDPAPLASLVELPAEGWTSLRLRLLSPLQLKSKRPPRASGIVDAAVQRVRTVARLQGVGLPGRWPDYRDLPFSWEGIRYARRTRYSQRQHQKVVLDGWVGSLRLGPEAAPFVELLAAASVLGLGRKTSMGLGWIALEARPGEAS